MTIYGLESLAAPTYIHKAVDVANGNYSTDIDCRPYRHEVAQAAHLTRVGDGEAYLLGRDSWTIRRDDQFENIVFYSATPYEMYRYIKWPQLLPTKNESTYQFVYIAADVEDRPDLVWIRESIVDMSDGSVFYEYALRVAPREDHEAILAYLDTLPYPHYMYTPNFVDMSETDAEWYKNKLQRALWTPAEAALATDTAESTWRNKAAAGEISGAFKKGKQWLLPRSVVEAVANKS